MITLTSERGRLGRGRRGVRHLRTPIPEKCWESRDKGKYQPFLNIKIIAYTFI